MISVSFSRLILFTSSFVSVIICVCLPVLNLVFFHIMVGWIRKNRAISVFQMNKRYSKKSRLDKSSNNENPLKQSIWYFCFFISFLLSVSVVSKSGSSKKSLLLWRAYHIVFISLQSNVHVLSNEMMEEDVKWEGCGSKTGIMRYISRDWIIFSYTERNEREKETKWRNEYIKCGSWREKYICMREKNVARDDLSTVFVCFLNNRLLLQNDFLSCLFFFFVPLFHSLVSLDSVKFMGRTATGAKNEGHQD